MKGSGEEVEKYEKTIEKMADVIETTAAGYDKEPEDIIADLGFFLEEIDALKEHFNKALGCWLEHKLADIQKDVEDYYSVRDRQFRIPMRRQEDRIKEDLREVIE